MASNTSSLAFYLPVAELTDLALDGPAGNSMLPSSKRLSLHKAHLDGLRSVDDLIICLDNLGVPGPLTVHAPALKLLGEGGQFTVHEGSLLDPATDCEWETVVDTVAVKTPKFGVLPDGQLDLASSTARRQINDFYLEVAALKLPALSNHPNIVSLFGWAVEETLYQAPLLVFEIALSTMAAISDHHTMTWRIRHQLCLDVGNGLDAIHDAGIGHSDLKPENVLIFRTGVPNAPLAAKLADFGASESDQDATEDATIEVKGLSYDWSAPEMSLSAKVKMSQMIKADVFSFGLLLLSFSCSNGVAPIHKDVGSAMRALDDVVGITGSYLILLTKAMPLLLHSDPAKRPDLVAHLLIDDSEPLKAW